jgi:predicted kinase
VLRSDVVRKELAGLAADQPAAAPFGEGIYTEGATADTYRELLARAEDALRSGEIVVLDASWTSEDRRVDARAVADATASDLIELRCVAPPDVVADRIATRAAAGGDASDADPAIAAAMETEADAWPSSVAIDTDADPAAALQAAHREVGPT